MRKLGIIFLSMLLILLCAVPTFATKPLPYIPYVLDNGNLFTDEEEALIATDCAKAESETGVRFVIATTTHSLWGEDILDHFGLSENADLVILVITLDYRTYYYDLYTYGKAASKISDREVDLVLDDPAVYDNLKSGALLAGSMAFTEKAAGALITPNLSPVNFSASFFFGVVALALLLSFLICVIVFASYKRKKRSTGYPLDVYTTLSLTEREDIFTGSYVTKRRISSSSSGGRSGGGGRSHGGGGGHRGGR